MRKTAAYLSAIILLGISGALQPASIDQYMQLSSLTSSNSQAVVSVKESGKVLRKRGLDGISRRKLKSTILLGMLLGSRSSG
ncbi:MAG: hypothetical protein ABW168_05240 [Sedimenticola sp.]